MDWQTISIVVGGVFTTIGGTVVGWYWTSKKQRIELTITQQHATEDLNAKIEARVASQWKDYANRLLDDNTSIREEQKALRKEYQDEIQKCREQCESDKDEIKREAMSAHSQMAATERLLARIQGWLQSVRSTLQKKGIDVPQWGEDQSGLHAALPPRGSNDEEDS